MSDTQKRITVSTIKKQKGAEPLVCLTAYSAPMARLADEYCDLLLVGDSLGMVLYGYDNTIPVTLEMMIMHGGAVVRGSRKSLIVVDMPFGSYQASPAQAFENSSRIMKEAQCQAVKLEGGAEMAETVSFLVQRGVPVLGHVGLKPQSLHAEGGYKIKGREKDDLDQVLSDALSVQDAGAFALILEGVTPDLAAIVTEKLSIPVIGIGASAVCDGQILVTEDMIGLTSGKKPRFVREYAHVAEAIEGAISQYAADVKAREFPAEDHLYASLRKAG